MSATSKPGLLLGKVLRGDSIKANNLTSTARLHTYLAKTCPLAGAAEIADLMDGYADPDTSGSLASVMFDPALPPADLTSTAIVFGTSNVSLPREEVLNNLHLYNTLLPAKSDLFDQRDQVPQGPLPARSPRERALPDRTGRAEVPVSCHS